MIYALCTKEQIFSKVTAKYDCAYLVRLQIHVIISDLEQNSNKVNQGGVISTIANPR